MEPTVLSLALIALSPVQVEGGLNDHFDLPRYYSDVAPEEFLLAADVNSDGRPDLVSRARGASFFSNAWGSISVWLNADGKSFDRTWQVTLPFSSDIDGQGGAELADFDGDGNVDLAYSKRSATGPAGLFEGMVLHLGQGDGTLAPAVLVPLPEGYALFNFVAADQDGDGRSEIVLYYRDDLGEQFVTVAAMDANGLTPETPFSIPGNIAHLRPADFTGDGVLDLLYMDSDWTTAHILEYQNGVYSTWETFNLPQPPFGDINMRPVVGDLEQDGDVDVLFALVEFGIGGTTRIALYENSPSGFSGLTQLSDLPGSPSIQGELVDWDNDGDLDWVGNGQSLVIAENDGGNNFTLGGTQLLSVLSSTSPGSVDLDGDGNLDYVGAETAIFGSGDVAIGDFDFSPFPAFLGQAGTVPRDIDGDGDKDLFVPVTPTTGQPIPGVFFNDASGGLSASSESYLGNDPDTGLAYNAYLGEADFDGDGIDEVLTYDRPVNPGGAAVQGNLLLLERSPTGEWVVDGPGGPDKLEILAPANGAWPAGDVDGDGDLDLFVQGGVHVNVDGNGLLFGLIPAYSGAPIDALDWDGDGDADALTDDNGDLTLWRNQGGFEFGPELLRSFESQIVLQTLDVDGDGDLDRVALSGGGGQVQIYLAGPNGFSAGSSLEDPDPFNHASNFGRGEVARGDVDGDGNDDLMLIRAQGNQQSSDARNLTTWLVDDGQGGLEVEAEWLSWLPFEMGDLDGDSDLDLYGADLVRGNGWQGLDGGAAQQFGEGAPGTGGVVPLFGVQGPYHKDSLTLTKRLRRGVGGGVGLYAVGLAGAELPGFPTPFITAYVDPGSLAALLVIPLDGTPGEPGAGGFDYPVAVQPFLTGFAFWEQVFVIDPGAPELLSASNALFVQLGN